MRLPIVLSVLSLAILTVACVTKTVPPVAGSCPPLTDEQSYRAVVGSLDAHFGKRHLGYHVISDARTVDAGGDTVLHLTRIAPSSDDQPGPGQGKRLDVVVQRCTGKVLRFYEP